MPYILFNTALNLPLARVDADPATAELAAHQIAIPCEPDADPDDVAFWQAEAAKPQPEPDPVELLTKAKAAKLAQMNALTDASLGALTSVYPQGELLTFDKQEAEARAFVADPASPTPLLSALATGRGITLDDLARRVIVKADAFSSVSGYIIGQRQALEDLLEQATTPEDVEAIQVAIAVPGSPPEPAPVPEAPMPEEPVLEAAPETPPATDAEAAA